MNDETYCPPDSQFHNRLKLAREEAGLSPVQAAELIGISEAEWNAMEHGRCVPDFLTGCRIAKAFDVSEAFLAGIHADRTRLDYAERT